MKKKTKPIVLDQFKHFSELAATLEKKGEYAQASDAWSMAAKVASNPKNQKWCESRYEFCEKRA
ncbi:ANR family transcriptional regulator [Glaesserella parasuis]|uniref:ANR family transcriptional regulator n=1 Tax=Glaesserella parasuis TaxID=738 RepID=UPI002436AF9B|nr:ANR family transcriptional regulator [Glaesserella parasuis]MDG6790446.1 ANR family transcriptional regulator [Glaesserella parasuis]